MYHALLLSELDVAALRAALIDPRFSALASHVPGLSLALQHPQPEFDCNLLGWVSDAVSEVCANTNFPEDWDHLDEAVDAARARRRDFDEALTQAAATAVVPAQASSRSESAADIVVPEYFCIVHERVGSGDPFELGDALYDDFDLAFGALEDFVNKHMQRPYSEEYVVASHAEVTANPQKYADQQVLVVSRNDVQRTAYMLHTYGGQSVRDSFFLQKFTKAAQAGGAA